MRAAWTWPTCRSGRTCACPATSPPAASTSCRPVRPARPLAALAVHLPALARPALLLAAPPPGLPPTNECTPPLPCAPRPAPRPADPDRPWCQVYTVQEGDSEREIAERFGLTEKELTKLNSGAAWMRGWMHDGERQALHAAGSHRGWARPLICPSECLLNVLQTTSRARSPSPASTCASRAGTRCARLPSCCCLDSVQSASRARLPPQHPQLACLPQLLRPSRSLVPSPPPCRSTAAISTTTTRPSAR